MGKVGTPDSVDVLRRILRSAGSCANERTITDFEKSNGALRSTSLQPVLPFPQGWQLRYCRQIRRRTCGRIFKYDEVHGRARRLPVSPGSLQVPSTSPLVGMETEQGVLQYASAEAVP